MDKKAKIREYKDRDIPMGVYQIKNKVNGKILIGSSSNLRAILNRFKAEPNQALYIGDSEIDCLVAEAAGVPFASYKNSTLKALYCFTDHMDLLKVLPPKIEKVVK